MSLATNEFMVRHVANGVYRPGFGFDDPFTNTKRRRFVSRFGVDPWIVAILWNLIIEHPKFPTGASIMKLLWSLCFLKTYDTENNLACFFGVDEKTFRMWNWSMLECLSTIPAVSNICWIFLLFLLLLIVVVILPFISFIAD